MVGGHQMIRLTRRSLLKTGAAQTALLGLPVAAAASDYGDQFPFEWQRIQLSNGARLYLAPNSSRHILAQFRVRYGEINERPGEDGLAHVLEHALARGGAGPHPHERANEIRDALPYENAITNLNNLAFFAEFNPDQLESFLELMSHAIFAPRLESEIIEQERRRVIEELSGYSSSQGFRHSRQFNAALYGSDHPLVSFDPEAEMATARRATQLDLFRFHERFGRSNLVDLFLVGGLPSNAAWIAEDYLAAYDTEPGTTKTIPPVPLLTKSHMIGPLEATGLTHGRSQIKLGWNTRVFFGHPDMAALTLALRHLKTRLHEVLSERMGMVYSLKVGFEPNAYSASITINASTQEDPYRVRDVILDVVDDIRTMPMTSKQLTHRKIRLRFLASKRMSDNGEVLERLERLADYGTSYYETGLGSVSAEEARRAAWRHFPERDGRHVFLIRQGKVA